MSPLDFFAGLDTYCGVPLRPDSGLHIALTSATASDHCPLVTRPCCAEDVHLSPRGSVAGTQPSDLDTIHEEPEDKDVQKIAGSSLPGQDSDAVSQDWEQVGPPLFPFHHRVQVPAGEGGGRQLSREPVQPLQ